MTSNDAPKCSSVCNLVVIQKGRKTTVPVGPCIFGIGHTVHLANLRRKRYRKSVVLISVRWTEEPVPPGFMDIPRCKTCGGVCVSLMIGDGAAFGRTAFGCNKADCAGFKDLLGELEETHNRMTPPPPCPKCKKYMWQTMVSAEGE